MVSLPIAAAQSPEPQTGQGFPKAAKNTHLFGVIVAPSWQGCGQFANPVRLNDQHALRLAGSPFLTITPDPTSRLNVTSIRRSTENNGQGPSFRCISREQILSFRQVTTVTDNAHQFVECFRFRLRFHKKLLIDRNSFISPKSR